MRALFIVLVLAATLVHAQQDKPQVEARIALPPGDPVTKTLVYDVRGLLHSKEDKDAGVQQYIKLIEDTIEAESWTDNGGSVGRVKEIDGLLIMTHTDDVHRQIDQLLNQLTEKHARLVRVRAHWIFGDPAQLRFGETGTGATREVDPAVLQNLPKDVIHHQAETVCFSGQDVMLKSGNRQSYVSDLNPVVGTQSVGYDPVVETVEDGAELKLKPMLQPDGGSAWVKLDSSVIQLVRSSTTDIRAVGGPTTQPAVVGGETVLERPVTKVQQLSTSLRVPVGKAVIVGGMTVQPGLQAPNGPQMMLVLEVFVD